MKTRQLTEEEIKACQKSIEQRKKRNEWIINYIIPMTKLEKDKLELELKYGIEKKYRDAIRVQAKDIDKADQEIKENIEQIDTLNKQIAEGVRPKYVQ